ncbi:MAG TPA: Rv3235 family protein [Actinomycetales bacterium]|nr:Rv3235 family protein [Actinomycetales bacterium]
MTAVVTAPAPSAARSWVRPHPRHPTPGRLRHLPLPDTEPPVERGDLPQRASASSGQGVLALPWCDETEDDLFFGPQATPTRELPEPARWGRQVTQLIVEVMEGHRPTTQLIRWTTDEVLREVRRRARPLPTGRDRTRSLGPSQRPVVGGVRVSEPCDGVAEVTAVVHRRHRVQAVALRLEGRDGRWVVTVLECG